MSRREYYGDKTLEKKIVNLQRVLDSHQSSVTEITRKLVRARACVQPTTIELYNGIDKYIDITIDDKEYEHILGGDGRSQPWSEIKKGKVADVKIKDGFWFNEQQTDTIIEYVQQLVNVDQVKIRW